MHEALVALHCPPPPASRFAHEFDEFSELVKTFPLVAKGGASQALIDLVKVWEK
jgi:hypothetical protein